MNIAFFSMGDKDWYGGVTHLRSLLYALHYADGEDVKKYLVCRSAGLDYQELFKPLETGTTVIPYHERSALFRIAANISSMLFARPSADEAFFMRKEKIDAIFGSCVQINHGEIPTLSYIWDFQYKHMPEMFSRKERFDTWRRFLRTAKTSSRIIVTSQSIKEDVQTFLPKYAHKVRIIQPVINIPESIYTTEPKFITKLYSLPEKFVYLPNQFWRHKNHKIVFDAVKILKKKQIRISIVCTGYPKDRRDKTYRTDLIKDLSGWNHERQVISLGMVPYEHVLLLMRQSICMVNPSLFEGFGLTASEAASLGKRALLSDIPAHHEHDYLNATFFDPRDADDLAGKLSVIWQQGIPGPDHLSEEKARRELPGRIKRLAQSFVSVIEEARKNS